MRIIIPIPARRRQSLNFSPVYQRGISLAMVLLSLVIMAVAAVGLARMVDTGSIITGNVAFKQGTTSSTDRGMEAALTWLQANQGNAAIQNISAGDGYHATAQPLLDVTWATNNDLRTLPDWDGDTCDVAEGGSFSACLATALAPDPNNDGYTVRYLITRLCELTGDHNQWDFRCMRSMVGNINEPRPAGAIDYTNVWAETGTPPSPIYRVIVRATGPRNTVSYTETYVQF